MRKGLCVLALVMVGCASQQERADGSTNESAIVGVNEADFPDLESALGLVKGEKLHHADIKDSVCTSAMDRSQMDYNYREYSNGAVFFPTRPMGSTPLGPVTCVVRYDVPSEGIGKDTVVLTGPALDAVFRYHAPNAKVLGTLDHVGRGAGQIHVYFGPDSGSSPSLDFINGPGKNDIVWSAPRANGFDISTVTDSFGGVRISPEVYIPGHVAAMAYQYAWTNAGGPNAPQFPPYDRTHDVVGDFTQISGIGGSNAAVQYLFKDSNGGVGILFEYIGQPDAKTQRLYFLAGEDQNLQAEECTRPSPADVTTAFSCQSSDPRSP